MIDDLIYDVGMNNGDDTAYYLARGYRVVAIEANPLLAKQGAERFAAEVAGGRLKILNVGVSDREGEFPFWICETMSEWSSFNRDIASRDGHPHHELMIPCQRFSSIVAGHGVPFYLKVDIEGNDMLCLRDLKGPDLPKYVSLEAAVADFPSAAPARLARIFPVAGRARMRCGKPIASCANGSPRANRASSGTRRNTPSGRTSTLVATVSPPRPREYSFS